MPKIFKLPGHVADLIAAGEVVERPASVVKELMENSIDAGAGLITVEINAGGMTFIRVTDNGCGISPEDAETAFLRHATSKLRGAEGLEAIGTLGFRGEALAAIAAVSRIELLTRERGSEDGISLTIESGAVIDMSPAGCPEGTTIIVRDLFFNTPARLKFMKSDRAEGSAIASCVLRCALSRPEVSIRFIKDGKTEYHTPGDSRIDSCIYSLLGRDFYSGLIEVKTEDESVAVEGCVSAPDAARGNRSYQFFFVNERPIRSVSLQAALEQAYANTLPSGRFPSCVLYVKTRLGDVDVNVHPAKTEVKFVSDKQVFDGVYYAALSALENQSELRLEHGKRGVESGADDNREAVAGDKSSPEAAAASAKGFKSMQANEFRKTYASNSQARFDGEQRAFGPLGSAQGVNVPVRDEGHKPFQTRRSDFAPERTDAEADQNKVRAESAEPDSSNFSTYYSQLFNEARIIGEALNVYIIVEYRDGVWFIDKHAAHERIHFDALKSDTYKPMSQALISPVICRHGYEDSSLLLENAELLDKLGFTLESFGEDSIAVRHIPSEIEIGDTEAVLSDICLELKRGGTPDPARRDNILRAVACKAAIKAGKSSSRRELEALTSRVMSGEVSRCPHGRPIAFELSKTALDRGFKRS